MKPGNKKNLLLSCSLAAMLGAALIQPLPVWAEEDIPSRDIYVIYDDSGSMYKDYGKDVPVDTWSKAKYSMEVFASMLSPDDTMKIYYMSDYSKDGDKDGARLVLEGEDDAKTNVLKIRNEQTKSGNTPFETVEEAYEDLQEADGEEKWLIVLTDGQFLNGEKTEKEQEQKLNEFLISKDSDINVIFLGLGQDAQKIDENRNKEIYSERAADADQIFDKVTEVFNRVYNTSSLKQVGSDGTFTLDVPMSQITVFVQGKDSEILGLVDENGKDAGKLDSIVDVETADDSDNKSHPDSKPKEKLEGAVAVFDGDFAPGTYQVKTKNAARTEIYYKPNLALTAWLEDSSGNKIDQMKDLPSGDYTIHFELISGLDQTPLPADNIVSDSGDLEYEAIIKNNGRQLDGVYKDGDTIHVDEGELDLDVTATFMRYNRISDHLSLSAFDDKTVTFEMEEPSEWRLGKTLESAQPTRLIMKVQDQMPTAEEWAQVTVPEITVNTDTETPVDAPVITKSDEPGVFLIEPQKDQSKFENVTYSKADLTIKMDETVDQIPWQGEETVEVRIRDNRSWLTQHLKWISQNWWWAILLPILLLILGALYIPGVKKYLPKLPKKMNIECKPVNLGSGKVRNEDSVFTINSSSTWMPFKPQEGRFRIVPASSDSDLPMMKVKAAGNNQMTVMNPAMFRDGNVIINGEVITDETKPFPKLKRSSEIIVKTKSEVYELHLNQKYVPDED